MLEWAGATFVKFAKIQAWQELVFVLSAISNIERREKASKLSFWWSDDNLWKNVLCCVYILTYAINILCCIKLLITLLSIFGYLLVFHSINYHSINYTTHQKVTKTPNNVINSSMKKKCRWHMSEYTHNKAYSFMDCHQTIRMIISKPFHDSQFCW